jgi:RHS repeat-associated protein
LRTRTYPDGGVEGFGYSAAGLVKYTNQLNWVTSYGYDAALRKTSETNASSQVLQFTYNAADDLRTLTDGKNQVTRWGYDAYGRVTSKTNQANTQILTWAYDASSRLTNRWSAAKGNTKYSYDGNGNLTLVDYPGSADITLSYDALNRLTNMVDAAGTTVFTYNSAGDLLTEDGPWSSDTVTYGYHASVPHLRTSLSLQQASGSWTNGFSYDGAHRLSSLSSRAGTFTCTYYGGGAGTSSSRLYKKLALPNGAYITNAYDNVARLTDTALKNSSNTILNDHSYLYNAGSQRTRQTRTDGSYVSYTYDNIGQLTGVRTTNSAGSEIAAERFGYLYDAAWNLNQKTNNTTVTVYSVDNRNQLTTCAGQSCTYDSNGNLTFQTIASRNYTYDDENQLVETDQSANSRTDLIYDGRMRLRKRVESTWNGSSWVQSSETRYLYDGMRVIQERDSSNTPTVSYTRGMDLSGTFEGAGGIGGLLARSSGYSAGAWSTNHYYHADGSGNITALVDSTQAISATYKYEPFGRTISSSGTMAVQNVYRFSSKEWLTGSGMYYYGFRVYEPSLQRWLNRDPIGEWGGINLYGFVENNPINLYDSFGLDPESELIGAILRGDADAIESILDAYGDILTPGQRARAQAALRSLKPKGPPKPPGNFRPPTTPPQSPPAKPPTGCVIRKMPPNKIYPDGYWKIEKPMPNGGWQGLNPKTLKPGGPADTHIPFPPGEAPPVKEIIE